ncbi:hypothetical protein ACFVUS_40765 [Nocardia sp. NPDC058058]|uniref:hypothetical protein n=1 Tax=Nocardia sp. NPDC058058 TaxID=3346317 RepID=UPI0036DF5C3B
MRSNARAYIRCSTPSAATVAEDRNGSAAGERVGRQAVTGDIAAHPGYRAFAEHEFDAVVHDPANFGRARWSTVDRASVWLRECLGHAEAGGLVAVAMPSSAATGPDSRALRNMLLRNGVLRGIISGLPDAPDLWLLRQSDTHPSHVLLIDALGEPGLASNAWRAFEVDSAHPDAAPYAVRVVDLLDDRIDLAPRGSAGDSSAEYAALRTTLVGQRVWAPPALESNSAEHSAISLEELVDAEAVACFEAPPTVASESGETPLLSAKDVRLGRPASRWGNTDASGAVTVRKGDVAVVISTEPAVRVCADDGVLLGSGIQLVRTNAKAVDPNFLAGVLRAAVDAADGSHVDLYQVAVPRIPLAEQRRYGAAFEQLTALETAWQQQRSTMERLVRTGFRGLAQGLLRPPDHAASSQARVPHGSGDE